VTRATASIRARLAGESGMALVVAVMVSALMLIAGLAILSFTDKQTQMTGKERLRESTLNLAEGALNAQANLLTAAWPETSDKAFTPCTQSSTSVKCPDATNLLNGFTSNDFGNGAPVSWHLSVRDNGLGAFYEDAATATQPAWDQNGPAGTGPDGIMWLRAQAQVRGEKRTVVSLIRATPVSHAFPRGVLTAGHFHTTNNGNKVIIDASGGPGVLARCHPGQGGPARGNSCLDYQVDKGQLWPNSWTSDTALPNAMTPNEVNALRNRAKATNNWFSSCPTTIPSGLLVFIESGPCTVTSNQQFNSLQSPGMLVIADGTLSLGGTTTFYGLIYAVNSSNSAGNVVSLSGNAQVFGAIVVDGDGGISAGSSKVNVKYDANAFNTVTTVQTINVIANSWRELNGQ
jgi:hypothetical protein